MNRKAPKPQGECSQREKAMPSGNAWQSAKLGDVCDLLPSRSVSTEGDVEVDTVTTACLSEMGFRTEGVKKARMWKDDAEESRLHCGELLIARSNTPDLVGRVALFNGEMSDVVASDLTIRLRPRENLTAEFLTAYLSHLFLTGYWRARASGASGTMKKITRSHLASLAIPVPPPVEQRGIASRLRKQMAEVERARTAVQAQLDASQVLSTALLRAHFADPTAQRWPHRRLGDIAEVAGGMQKTPNRAPRLFHKQFLTVRNVQRGYLNLTNVERFEVTPAEFERLRLQRGDLLIVEGNGSADHIGRNALFNEDGEWIHQNHIIRVRLPKDQFVPEFVSSYLNSDAGRAQMTEKAKSTTGLYTLSTKKVAALEIPAPPLEMQRELAARVIEERPAVEQLRQSLELRLSAIEHLPGALLRQAFFPA